MGSSHSRSKTEVHSVMNQESYQRTHLTSHLKESEKENQMKPKVRRKKETTKIGVETNERKTKKTIEKINETRGSFLNKDKR